MIDHEWSLLLTGAVIALLIRWLIGKLARIAVAIYNQQQRIRRFGAKWGTK